MVRPGKGIYFYSRPRRFGKSLTLSTLKAVFQAKKELFKGTALYNKPFEWESYSIIHLDMGSCGSRNADELEKYLLSQIERIASDFEVDLRATLPSIAFQDLITALSKNNQKVVILLDEYDKPILNNILSVEAPAILQVLKGFYSVIITCEPYERFVFITGVSKFSHVSVFSDLNNLTDITMDLRFAHMTGYTQEELEYNFEPYIADVSTKQGITEQDLLEKIKHWYNGYRFHAESQTVYNPSSIAQYFVRQGDFSNYWFSTGTPTFLFNIMKLQEFDIENALTQPVSEIAFSAYEVESINPLALLLQTGYLTIKDTKKFFDETQYFLDFPNFEVESAFETYLLDSYTSVKADAVKSIITNLLQVLDSANIDEFMKILTSFYASIPYDLHIGKERYYQTIFYVLFSLIGTYIEAESRTNDGRIDAVCHYNNNVFIFEFKLDKDAKIALDQIKEKEYYKKYENRGKNIFLIGVNFDKTKGQITNWKKEHA